MEYRYTTDLSALATLRAVVERGGVNAAAQALHIGQPAVSKRLRSLEEMYKLPLVEKMAGRLRLTEAGEKVYGFAVQTLDRQTELFNKLGYLRQGRKVLRLEVTFAIGEHFLSSLLVDFSEVEPLITVESRLAYGRQIETDLATGLADVALLENAPDHPDILVQKWMEDELVLVCGSGHPLANASVIAVDKLTDFNYVLREKRSSVRDALDEALAHIEVFDLSVHMEVGSTDAITDILSHGKFASFLPLFAVRSAVKTGLLHRIHIEGVRMRRTLWLARHRSCLDTPEVNSFISVVKGQTRI